LRSASGTTRNLLATPRQILSPNTRLQIPPKRRSFSNIEFCYRPIADVRDIEEVKHNIPISINLLVKTFDCQRNPRKSTLEHRSKPPGN
jgi:hypothetical protein